MSDKPLPWGMDSSKMQPSSMSKISSKKLKAFSEGSMNTSKKKTPFQLKKEAEEKKRKQAEQDAAKAYAEFKEYYEEKPTTAKTFVRADVIPGDDDDQTDSYRRGGRKLWKPDDGLRRHGGLSSSGTDRMTIRSAPEPKPKKGGKKMSQMELFKEKIKRDQQERDKRRAAKATNVAGPGTDFMDNFASEMPLAPLFDGERQKGSFDNGDPSTTNLYVGNLSPLMNEAELCRIFGKFGPLASVKIMWPRSTEEKSRGRMCGFVAFMKRKDGDACLEALSGKVIMDFEIKLGWGKAVALPPRPFYVHAASAAGRKIKTGLPFNAQPKPMVAGTAGVVLSNDVATATVVVVIPGDRAVRQLIHRTIEFVIREGPEFEELLIQRTSGDGKYKFLTQSSSHEHTYYRWKLFSLLQGDRVDRWSRNSFKMFVGGSEWEPPAHDQVKQNEEVEKGHLSTDGRDKLEDLLHKISLERRSIAESMVFCIHHADASQEVIECIAESLCILETPILTKVARLFLVSDILNNCSAHVRNASSYRHGFEVKLPQIFKALNETYKSFTGRLRAEQFRQYVSNCLAAWKDWNVFAPEFFSTLENLFKYGTEEKPKQPAAKPAAAAKPASGGGWTAIGSVAETNDSDDDDVDGVPMDDEDLDGEPLDGPVSTSAKRPALSKWEVDDDDDDDDDRDAKRHRNS